MGTYRTVTQRIEGGPQRTVLSSPLVEEWALLLGLRRGPAPQIFTNGILRQLAFALHLTTAPGVLDSLPPRQENILCN